jgi:3-deoxy-D-manno-octulosonic acid hydroxylase-like protein
MATLEERLERGEIVTFEPCPFPLPTGEDLTFLMQQQLKGVAHKNISYNPDTRLVTGFALQSLTQVDQLHRLLGEFSRNAIAWLRSLLPRYAQAWLADRASFRPEEEATRKLRLTARNDLLHFDAFPSRPTRGQRILRLYVNINPTDDRVWMTSDTFAKVLERYGEAAGLPTQHTGTWLHSVKQGLVSLFQPNVLERTAYDEFMLRLHHYLKTNDDFQERAPRRIWHFKPQTAWLLFSDTLSHAELRGQYALEHSFFVAPHSLMLPDESPPILLERTCRRSGIPQAA